MSDCHCESFDGITCTVGPVAPGDPCCMACEEPALFTATITGLDGKVNYQVTAPTNEECRAMLKAVGIEVTMNWPGWRDG